MPDQAGFTFTSFRDFLKFIEYVGNSTTLEFETPVLDKTGATLIQKGLHFREGMLKNLWKFFNQSNLNEIIGITDSRNLRAAVRDKICRSLMKCLDSGRFHIAQTLADASQMNLQSMLSNLVERRDVLPVFLKLDQIGDPLLPHLGEVALVAAGLAEQFSRQSSDSRNAREIVRTAMFAGLLHDFSLTDDDDFLVKDIEQAHESQHAAKSADLVKGLLPELSEAVLLAISEHHGALRTYNPDVETQLTPAEISSESLALAEYVFVQLRSQYKKDESMSSAELLFYDLGRAFGRGAFHPRFRKIAASLWESLFQTLQYGFEIGVLEQSCPHKPSAVAYPNPRCTQILCLKNIATCAHFESHSPMEIIQPMKYPGRPGEFIASGKYAKCRLAASLPSRSEKKIASTWLAKGSSAEGSTPGESEA